MRKPKRVTGQVVLFASVNATPTEATLPEAIHSALGQALAQLRQALGSFGPFVLGPDMSFVQGGVKLDVLDASKSQSTSFDQAAFVAFVRRAHDICLNALHAPGDTSDHLTDAAESFAADEERDAHTIKKFFSAITTCPNTSLISDDGEIINVGVNGQPKAGHDPDMEIEVARLRNVVRITTMQAQFDVPAELAEGLQVGQHICVNGDEPPTGAAFIRADSVEEAKVDPTGELFDGSVAAEPACSPDDTE